MAEIAKLIPNLRGLVDQRAEQLLYETFNRIYEFYDRKLEILQQENTRLLQTKIAEIQKASALVNDIFATPLIGVSSSTNPLVALGVGTVSGLTAIPTSIFTVTNPTTAPELSLHTQIKNKFLAGPTTGADAVPSFRSIVAADLTGLALDTNILEWLAQ